MSNKARLEEIQNTLAGSYEVYQVLADDLRKAGELIKEDASNFRFRTFIRTLFAFVEGSLFGIKQVALKIHEHYPCFTEAELSLLREVTYELGDRGKVREKTKHLDTLNNIRFTIKSFAKAFGVETGITFNEEGWHCFQELMRIRHQITHPKDASSLLISETDSGQGQKVDLLFKAAAWYGEAIKKTSDSMLTAIRAKYIDRE